jgi:hypothetical protein
VRSAAAAAGRAALLAGAATLAAPAVPAPARADPTVVVGGIGGTIYYGVSSSSPSGSGSGGGPPSGGGPAEYALVPVMQAAGAGYCVALREVAYPSEAQASAAGASYAASWPALLSMYPLCTPGGELPPSPPPAVVAAAYWQDRGEDLLPHPRPFVPPGYALTGNPAYLEAQLPLTETFTNPTQLGDLAITAAAVVSVDWGDGTGWQGPFGDAGAPWPEGDITHVWDDTGSYDIVVRATWRASWSLNGEHGTLAGLSTEGALDGFSVHELESVRNR